MVARHENPRSSAPRDHSTMSSPVAPGVVLGSPIPIFTRSPFPGVGSNNPTGPGAPPTGQLLTRAPSTFSLANASGQPWARPSGVGLTARLHVAVRREPPDLGERRAGSEAVD